LLAEGTLVKGYALALMTLLVLSASTASASDFTPATEAFQIWDRQMFLWNFDESESGRRIVGYVVLGHVNEALLGIQLAPTQLVFSSEVTSIAFELADSRDQCRRDKNSDACHRIIPTYERLGRAIRENNHRIRVISLHELGMSLPDDPRP
jgi:hypothetical protein